MSNLFLTTESVISNGVRGTYAFNTPTYAYESERQKVAEKMKHDSWIHFKETEERMHKEIKDVKIIVPDKVVEATFADGTKQKAVCSENDTFSLEVAISICISKQIMGGSSAYNKAVRNGMKAYKEKIRQEEEKKKQEEEIALKKAKKEERRKKKAEEKKRKEIEEQIEIQKEVYTGLVDLIIQKQKESCLDGEIWQNAILKDGKILYWANDLNGDVKIFRELFEHDGLDFEEELDTGKYKFVRKKMEFFGDNNLYKQFELHEDFKGMKPY